MKKKLLFLIPNLKHGGAERVLVNLVNHLDTEKYDITVQTLFDVGVNKQYLAPHIRYRAFLKHEFRGNSYLFRCLSPSFWWDLIVKEHYDIAISYLEGPTARILSGCRDCSTRRIAWIHIELNTPELAAQGFQSVDEAKKAYESFERVVAVSEGVKRCFLESLSFAHPIEVLYNTNETELLLENARYPVSDSRFITGDIPAAISVAKLMKTKGFDRLLSAHERLLQDGLRHRIYILGMGEEQKRLEAQITSRGLQDSFILLGFQENPYKYVARADLYVCSSRREGFSTAVTEALILGVPVVSTDCSGAKELLGENNEYGLVVENSTEGIYQGMKEMLSDAALLLKYRERAAERGNQFSTEKTVSDVEIMFDEL